ncbi:hypothetical protein STSP_67050 [Streptomyces jeddahensis]|uniref:Uncharacterized protein n=1 Tax=Streptomyces jeddahensis TaxID=1716141 RepID=A0A177HH62_9ACTN|nr:hypothetical protein STSP_67050 [Streptomyces jeddahensis]
MPTTEAPQRWSLLGSGDPVAASVTRRAKLTADKLQQLADLKLHWAAA